MRRLEWRSILYISILIIIKWLLLWLRKGVLLHLSVCIQPNIIHHQIHQRWARELVQATEIDQIWEEYPSNNCWLVVFPHEINEYLNRFLDQSLFFSVISEHSNKQFSIIILEHPVHIHCFDCHSLHRLSSMFQSRLFVKSLEFDTPELIESLNNRQFLTFINLFWSFILCEWPLFFLLADSFLTKEIKHQISWNDRGMTWKHNLIGIAIPWNKLLLLHLWRLENKML